MLRSDVRRVRSQRSEKDVVPQSCQLFTLANVSRLLQNIGQKLDCVIIDINVLTILNHSMKERLKQKIDILGYLLRLTAYDIFDLFQTLVRLRSILEK